MNSPSQDAHRELDQSILWHEYKELGFCKQSQIEIEKAP